MQSVLTRLVEKINQAPNNPLPSENIYMGDVFDAAAYSQILLRLPTD